MDTNAEQAFSQDDAILPDGWDESKDFFSLMGEDAPGDAADKAEDSGEGGQDAAEPPQGEPQDGEPAGTADGQEPVAEEAVEDTATEETPAEEQVAERIVHYKHNHEEYAFDVGNATDKEIAELLQKARAFDERKAADERAKYQSVFQSILDEGYPEAIAAAAAANATGGKTFPLEDAAPEAEQQPTPAPQATSATPAVEKAPIADGTDFNRQLAALKTLFPAVTEMPKEVMAAYRAGVPLVTAYMAHASKTTAAQRDAEMQALRKENNILKQNARAAAKAPVKGVSGGGVREKNDGLTETEREFLRGMDDPYGFHYERK